MKMKAIPLSVALLLIAAPGSARAGSPPDREDTIAARRGPDPVDLESTRQIRACTTDPSFLTAWVDYIPDSSTVPSPRDFLGYVVGTPNRLTQPQKINAYFQRLAETTDRVRVFPMGRSHGGRQMIIAAIADADILARLEEIKAANRSLADPRRTTREEAGRIASTFPATYWMTAGLHSPETGPPEMVMELAYRLAVSEQEHIREIRANVLTLISPVLEMDGRARMVDWYHRFLTGVTELEDSPPAMAPYGGDYTAHDNKRDGQQVTQPHTRNYIDTKHEFQPTVSLDLHESVPLLYASMGTGPYNDTIDPITVTEWQWLSAYDVSQATKLGLRGVWTWGFYTGWYPGYLLWVTNNHNAVGRFYETFGNSNPGTFTRDLKHSRSADRRINSRQWYRPWPPEKKLEWSLRNNTNYMQTGVLAALQLAARNGETLLFNFWQKGFNSLHKGETEPPYAFIIPQDQRDRGNLHHLLRLLARHRIEVHEATYDTGLSEELTLERGDYIVRMDQPYRNFTKTLLMKQEFPKTADLQPYEDIAWSLNYMLGVDIHPANEKSILAMEMRAMPEAPHLPGSVDAGGKWLIEHKAQTSLAGLRWAIGEVAVRALAEPWAGHPAGSLIVDQIDPATALQLSRDFHIDLIPLSEEPSVATVDVDLPRIAMYHTWRYTQDSGWARYTFEQLPIPYTLINKDDVRAGGLADRFDVIVVPDQGRLGLKEIVQGLDRKWGPMPYTKTAQFPSHGVIDSSQDITGGMGFEGLANL
ncbi:MAG: M14 family zinc carboxypeptidase, partial [Longimicrobiales bacterium]